MHRFVSILVITILCWLPIAGHASADTLESELQQTDRARLAKQAHIFGDASRGAILFYRLSLSCVQCHTAGEGQKQLGPDLSLMRDRATFPHVIESLLEPSKAVEKGYKSEKVLLDDGQVLVGIIRKETDQTILMAVPGEEHDREISVDQIEARAEASSIMPDGLVNQLEDENAFFDLVCFLVELGRGGPENAKTLKPDAELIAPPPLPAYENDLDHRGLIASWNDRSFEQGEQIYEGKCVNCHGTREQAGSLPNAMRFADGKFKNGADPLSMYKTITHGYKMMLPQHQLVPRQKYSVIHYIREAYLKAHNPGQYVEIDRDYLDSLPSGRLRGPEPVRSQPWSEMDYGPFLTHTYEITGEHTQRRPEVTAEDKERGRREGRPAERTWPDSTNFAYKGIAISLGDKTGGESGGVSAGNHFVVFEHDTLRIAGVWTGNGFVDWQGILLDGKHWRSPRTVGELQWENRPGPGWADPRTGSLEDTRWRARDGQAYGPFPKEWMDYRGLYKHGNRVVLSYRIGGTDVLESHRIRSTPDETPVITRVLNIAKSEQDLTLMVGPVGAVAIALTCEEALEVSTIHDKQVVRVAADQTPLRFEVHLSSSADALERVETKPTAEDLDPLTHGGPSTWPNELVTQIDRGDDRGAFAVDTLTRPIKNPWKSRLRMSGLDFVDDDTMVACCCDGDVWRIEGIASAEGRLRWRRIASGLFHPLGIQIVGGRIFVSCRDQIVVLNDLNGDLETDFYQCFNHDHQVTEHFHEFAMGLQADRQGNLYYAKSARHAQDSLVPQHGTLLKVDADGSRTTILANGFRAANGVCLNADGSFFVTDQEGHWTPMNRINRVVEGGFYGNMYSFGAPEDSSDDAMRQPLCWPNKSFDRSPAELLWVDSDRWGALDGGLLSLSYGYGKVFVVPHEQLSDEQWQGGMCRLPLPRFDTGVMRGRFHSDGQLYACGMNAWGTNQTASPGGLYRIRATGKPMHLPVGFHAQQHGLSLRFTDPVQTSAASDPDNYLIECWELRRTANYGSGQYDRRELEVSDVWVADDGRSVELTIPKIEPTWTIQVAYKLRGLDGRSFGRVIQGSIHQLGD